MSYSTHNQTGKRQHYDAEAQAWADEMECWKRQRTSEPPAAAMTTPAAMQVDDVPVTSMTQVGTPMKAPLPAENTTTNWAMMNLKQWRQHEESPKKRLEARRDMVRLWNQKS